MLSLPIQSSAVERMQLNSIGNIMICLSDPLSYGFDIILIIFDFFFHAIPFPQPLPGVLEVKINSIENVELRSSDPEKYGYFYL